MSQPGNHDVLNRLLTVLYRSLPMYLMDASPWTHHGDEKAVEVLNRIVEDQQQLATRIAEHVVDHYGAVELGDFPLDFPDTNDLAFDYLVGKLVACQKIDVASIERCMNQLKADFEARSLAEEALGSAKGHLESLEELAAEVARSGGTPWVKR